MKQQLKTAARILALVIVCPAILLYRIAAPLLGRDQAFSGWSQYFSLFPGTIGVYLRQAFYSAVFPRCGDDAWIGFGTVFSHATASVGNKAYLGVYCCIGDVTLEDDVLIGSHVSIANGGRQHGIERLDIPVREQPGEWPRVTIGADTWVGDRAVVLADVGKHCVIGAGSVVASPIPDYAIAVGNPARIVRFRNRCEPLAELITPACQPEVRASH